jgi:hypothetical protein
MSIFQNGVWSCGFDFLADGTIPSGNVFDVGSTGSGGPSVGATAARFSGKGITIPSSAGFIGRSLSTNLASVITGFSFKTTAVPTSGVVTIATLYDATAGQPQATLGYNSTGKMGFYSVGGVQENNIAISGQIGALSAPGTVIPNSYDFWEIAGTINNVSGALTLKKNGVSVLTFSGDTQVTANAYVNRIYFGQSNPGAVTIATHYIDDMYILDLTGAAPLNTFLGPGRLQTDGPIGESSTAGLNAWAFTTPQGTDYGNAASVPPSVSNYNSSATVGQRMSFRFPGAVCGPGVIPEHLDRRGRGCRRHAHHYTHLSIEQC